MSPFIRCPECSTITDSYTKGRESEREINYSCICNTCDILFSHKVPKKLKTLRKLMIRK